MHRIIWADGCPLHADTIIVEDDFWNNNSPFMANLWWYSHQSYSDSGYGEWVPGYWYKVVKVNQGLVLIQRHNGDEKSFKFNCI